MTETWSGNRPRELNDDTIAAVRRRIGIPVRYTPRAHNEVSSTDSFRHFAMAYGDDNPLYTDPEYAAGVGVGFVDRPAAVRVQLGPLAPGGVDGGREGRDEGRSARRHRPVHVRRALAVRAADPRRRPPVAPQHLFSADLKTSTFGGGTGALVSHRVSWEDDDGAPFAFRFLDFWHADREKSQKAAKNRTVERPRVHRRGRRAHRRGVRGRGRARRDATPRRDVNVGDELDPIVKGPLTITEMVAWHVGIGWGEYGGGASKVAYKNRQRVPKFYLKNQLGFAETAQRCHWDDEWAQRMGHPAAYDYGVMRTNWMVNAVTNWMGDDAWIWTLSASVRKFNYMGDVHFISGVVREVDRATNTVTIDVQGVNQHGEPTCDARAVVILPPDGGGAAVIPEYDAAQVPEAAAP